MARYLDTLAHPWSKESIRTAIFKSFSEARLSIEDTAGGMLWQSLRELEDTIWILGVSITDLLDEIVLFGDRSKAPSFWSKSNPDDAERCTRSVKRKIFNATSAVMALVDHARNFQREYPVVGYKEKLTDEFSIPGLHDFLQCLRNYNSHWRIAEANWLVRHNADTKVREAIFHVTKTELLRWDKWSVSAKQFISRASDEIDVYDLFSNYNKHVQSFYEWHRGAVLDRYAQEIHLYLEYKRLYEGIQGSNSWNLILSHVPEALNPYQYLSRYLTRGQVERLLAYEHRSEEQVDALIGMLHMDEFCDSDLRKKLLNVFKVRIRNPVT